jgi:uncharacterized membrane protein HdeD (DUF308 family)
MNRELALKVLLVIVGLLFLAGGYFLVLGLWQRNQSEIFAQMMLSVYVTLGVFVLLAVRNPSANRSLIAFTAWSSIAHAAVMAIQVLRKMSPRGDLGGVLLFLVIGVILAALAPAKQSAERASGVSA